MKIVKGIGKAVGKVFKSIKKAWKQVTSSTVGKIALAAAAIYFGGAAMGAWGSPGATAEASALAPVVDAVPTMAASMDPIAGNIIGQTVQAGTVESLKQGLSNMAIDFGMEKAKGGIISSFLKNPIVQQAIAGGVASAFAPDQMDLVREQQKQEERRRQMAYGGIGDINIGVRPAGQQNVSVQSPSLSSTPTAAPPTPYHQKDSLGNTLTNPYGVGTKSGIIARNMQRNQQLMGTI